MPEVPAADAGSVGLGLDAAAEAQLAETIAIMFGMKILMDQREEDKEMFPEEGVS